MDNISNIQLGDSRMKRKYQFFISSTYTDLIQERAAAIEYILGLSHIPVGMEMFCASNDAQWKVITNTIDSSDVYILIIGNRYGSICASENKSYTEMEFL